MTYAAPPATEAAALDHLAIYVRDVFDLQQVPAPVPFARWLVMSNGTMLHIVGGRPNPVDDMRDGIIFALSCHDLSVFIARLDAKGIKWSDLNGQPVPQSNVRGRGMRQIFLQDPDGDWIAVNDAHRN